MGAFVNLCQKAILLLKREQKKKKKHRRNKRSRKNKKGRGPGLWSYEACFLLSP